MVVIALGLAALWLATSAREVRDALEAARGEVTAFEESAWERRLDELPAIAQRLEASAAAAVEPTASPLWRAAESAPFVGENFRAVRVIAEGVDSMATEIVTPASALIASFALSRDPATGRLDVRPLAEATQVSSTARRVMREVRRDIRSIDTGATVGQVGEAVSEFDRLLATAEEGIPQVDGVLKAVSEMLGVSRPRNVVLAFLNNAETTALGGGPAAQTLLEVDSGSVKVARQVSSSDFAIVPVSVDVDSSAAELYDDIFFNQINATTSRPDFPTAARLISAYWQRDVGVTPDIVVTIDPIALARFLKVTGPVTLPDGETVASDNVVSKLLSEAYFRFPTGGPESDAYFATVATAVFDRVMSIDYDVWAMAQALSEAADRGSLMMWSSSPETQALFADTRLQGVLPEENDDATVLGAYFRDRSSSKIDYYLHSEVTVTTDACAPAAPMYTAEARLRFDIPAGVELPPYVESGLYDFYRTEVFLYGPVGATTASVEVPNPGLRTATGPSVTDLNRPAEKFTIDLENLQTAVVRATFAGAPGQFGPTEVRTTPMINATTVILQDAPC